MERANNFSNSKFGYLASAALLMGWLTASALAQRSNQVIIDDWTTHHVIFSDPGTLKDAIMNGNVERWQRIVSNPRYRMQQMRRNLQSAAQPASTFTPAVPRVSDAALSVANVSGETTNPGQGKKSQGSTSNEDWSSVIGSSGFSTPAGMFPAKFGVVTDTSENCADFVVFPVNQQGSATQAVLVGFNNLYPNCAPSGPVPSLLFAFYFPALGTVRTSPVVSLDGTKIAFVESRIPPFLNGVGTSRLHVLQLSTNGGDTGRFTSSTTQPVPVLPMGSTGGILGPNNAVDRTVDLGADVTLSSPFVDYLNDVAYLGDDNGMLHKITGVFNGTPAEASGFPVSVVTGVAGRTFLTPPVFDGGAGNSNHIFVTAFNGNLYCFNPDGTACPNSPLLVAATSGPFASDILSPLEAGPIVDSSTQKVFVAANSNFGSSTSNARALLVQVDTSLGSEVVIDMGPGIQNRWNGTFDNLYFTSTKGANGHMYFCGAAATGQANPTLYRVGFDPSGSGTMVSENISISIRLGMTGSTSGQDCTPLTEAFNPTTGIDFLFLGVIDHSNFNCAGATNTACVMSFILPASGAFPSAPPNGTYNPGGSQGTSGIIVDNVVSSGGGSNIYFGNLAGQSAVSLVLEFSP